MFRVKIADAAKRAGCQLTFVQDRAGILRESGNRPDLIVLDLDCGAAQPMEAIAELKRSPDRSGIPIIGYVSHVRADLIAAARDAGCDKILARSAFVQNLPEILTGDFGTVSEQSV